MKQYNNSMMDFYSAKIEWVMKNGCKLLSDWNIFEKKYLHKLQYDSFKSMKYWSNICSVKNNNWAFIKHKIIHIRYYAPKWLECMNYLQTISVTKIICINYCRTKLKILTERFWHQTVHIRYSAINWHESINDTVFGTKTICVNYDMTKLS